MINAEKYKDRILEVASNNKVFGLDTKTNKIDNCSSMNCRDCLFYTFGTISEHDVNRIKWLLSEYKEPPVKVSKLEYEFLKWSEKKGHKYIVRDKINHLFIFKDAPIKRENCWVPESSYCSIALFDNLFKFIKQEDEEPRAIKDILENCVVVEDAEE